MKKNKSLKVILAFIFLCLCTYSQAQVKIDWSERKIQDDQLDGSFRYYLGTNSEYIYAKYQTTHKKVKKKKIKIIAFNKNTMQKVSEAGLTGYDKMNNIYVNHPNIEYYKSIVSENGVYLFWKNYFANNQNFELLVQVFDKKLNVTRQLTKIYDYKSEKNDSKKAALFVMGNENGFVIGNESSASKNENIQLNYQILDSDLKQILSKSISLPIKVSNRKTMEGLSSSYLLGNEMSLYIQTDVNYKKEEEKKLIENQTKYFWVINAVNLKSGEIKNIPVNFSGKNFYSFGWKEEKGILKLYSFFSDLLKDPDGQDLHGIFSSTFNGTTFTTENSNFSYFTKKMLDNLFADDIHDRKKTKSSDSEMEKKSEQESLLAGYRIEDVKISGSDLILFSSNKYNYSVELNGSYSGGNPNMAYTREISYCDKKNLTIFKINSEGEFVWYKNLDRLNIYPNKRNVYDIKVTKKDHKYYVFYSTYPEQVSKGNNNVQSRILNHGLIYCVVDDKDGSHERYKIDNKGKLSSLLDISVLENEFYTEFKGKDYVRPREQGKTSCCYLPGLKGNPFVSDGYLGKISPIK